MTSKEKIEKAWELVNSKHIETNEEIQLVRYAVRMARDLAERDTPKRVCYDNLGRSECPSCDKSYLHNGSMNRNKYCGYCGQRLCW